MDMPAIDCDVIVLAGGFGTRLRSVVSDVPKPMAPVAGLPFLAHLLRSLRAQGAERVVLSVGFMGHVIQEYFWETYEGLSIKYAAEPEPLGTGGAMIYALDHCESGEALVLNGDTFLSLNYAGFLASCKEARADLGIVVRQVPDTTRYGRCELHQGRLTSFSEKGTSGPGLINAGVYYLRRSLFDRVSPPGQRFSFENDYIAPALPTLMPVGYVADGYFIDIGVPEDYARAQIDFSLGGSAAGGEA